MNLFKLAIGVTAAVFLGRINLAHSQEPSISGIFPFALDKNDSGYNRFKEYIPTGYLDCSFYYPEISPFVRYKDDLRNIIIDDNVVELLDAQVDDTIMKLPREGDRIDRRVMSDILEQSYVCLEDLYGVTGDLIFLDGQVIVTPAR